MGFLGFIIITTDLWAIFHFIAPQHVSRADWFENLVRHFSLKPHNPNYFTGPFLGFNLGTALAVLGLGTLSGYFLLSFLGLYGVFILCISLLLVTLSSLLSLFSAIIFKGMVVHLTLFK